MFKDARKAAAIAMVATTIACSGGASSPTAPTKIVVQTSSAGEFSASQVAGTSPVWRRDSFFAEAQFATPVHGTAVTFPPRNEPLAFRTALEAKYRDSLRRPAVETYVDQEGTVVWTQEYLRYRVNLCSHSEAVAKVMNQIDGQGVPAACGTANTATFPPRNEPMAFMVSLESKYRDGIRRSAGTSFVDVEGNIVWTQEYLRYRVSGCGHTEAQQKVFDQIDGRGVQADCTPAVVIPSPSPSPSPIPSPSPNSCGPRSAPCGTATAVCNDGSLSCSQNRQGTCSSHRGVACWICPGRLCNG